MTLFWNKVRGNIEKTAARVQVTEAEAEQVLSDPKRGAYACRCSEIDRSIDAIDAVLAEEA